MQIIIPMAGIGERFIKAGHKNIKPLIQVNGKPIIEYVINLFPNEDDFLFVCNSIHLASTPLKETLLKLKPNSTIIGIDGHTKGPVHSVVKILNHIKDQEQVIFSYCDYNMVWDYKKFKEFVNNPNISGTVTSYIGFHPHLLGPNYYAGVKTNEENKILEIKEKYCFHPDKLQGWHSSGLYYFKSGELAKKYFLKHSLGVPHENGEYYISTVYNDLIKDNLYCYNYPIEYFCQWGTPEDLAEYNMWIERINNNYIPKNTTEEKILNYWQKFSLLNNH